MNPNVLRYDCSCMEPEGAYVTEEGYIRAKAIVTRTGVFTYANGDGTQRKELRLPDDVFNTDAINSIKLIPVTNGHPQEKLVTAENSKRLAVGFTGDVVEQNGDYVLANFVITDSEAVKAVQDGRRELSLGYTVDLIPEQGNYDGEQYDYRQTNIRYNHLALVDFARAGSIARIHLDSSDAIQITGDNPMTKRKVKIDNVEYMVEAPIADIVERHESSGDKSVDHLEDNVHNLEQELERVRRELEVQREELARARRERDEAEAERDTIRETSEIDSKDMIKRDSADFNKIVADRVNERVKLFKTASSFINSEELSRLDSASDIDVKKAVILANKRNVSLDGKSSVYIETMYDLLVSEAYSKPLLNNVTAGIKNDSSLADPASARQAMIQRDANRLNKPKSEVTK